MTNFHIPECPTADGSVDASGSEHFEVTTEVRDSHQVVSRQSTSFDHSAKVHGEVGADAKLKFIKVEHTEDVLIVASRAGSYPIVLRGKAVRKIKVDMPGGNYSPAGATVNFSGEAREALTGRGFATTVDAAIRRFRSAEAALERLRPNAPLRGAGLLPRERQPEIGARKGRPAEHLRQGAPGRRQGDGGEMDAVEPGER